MSEGAPEHERRKALAIRIGSDDFGRIGGQWARLLARRPDAGEVLGGREDDRGHAARLVDVAERMART